MQAKRGGQINFTNVSCLQNLEVPRSTGPKIVKDARGAWEVPVQAPAEPLHWGFLQTIQTIPSPWGLTLL